MKHELVKLPYDTQALEPVINADTIAFHHGKHLLGYVNTLNSLIEGTEMENMPLEEIVRKSSGKVFNNAGQVLNHNLYFTQFTPKSSGAPSGALLKQIEEQFSSMDNFMKEFENACVTLFGSGWTWLAADEQGKLHILQEPNAGNPLTQGFKPLLGFDVWEHSYYLGYQNRRADHVHDLWQIVDWNVVEKRYA